MRGDMISYRPKLQLYGYFYAVINFSREKRTHATFIISCYFSASEMVSAQGGCGGGYCDSGGVVCSNMGR